MKSKKSIESLSDKEFEAIGRDFWKLYELNYKNRNRMYLFTFGKGIAQGFGIFIGGTIVVTVLLYGLSFFSKVPVIDKIYNVLKSSTTIQQKKP